MASRDVHDGVPSMRDDSVYSYVTAVSAHHMLALVAANIASIPDLCSKL